MKYYKYENAPDYIQIRKSIIIFKDGKTFWYKDSLINRILDYCNYIIHINYLKY